jgi:hypothetical protein
MRQCVVSFADDGHNGMYREKMKRLEASIKKYSTADFLGFTDYKEIGSPIHKEIPYAFKPYAIWKAIEMGYESILWLDSPIVAIKDISHIFEYIERFGYLFFRNVGHPLGKWSHDKALKHFGKTREDAMKIDQVMACAMGFCVGPSAGHSFTVRELILRPYKDLAPELYPGSWENSRHDQMVMSFIINKHGLDIVNGHETFFIYEHFKQVPEFQPIADSVCLISQ